MSKRIRILTAEEREGGRPLPHVRQQVLAQEHARREAERKDADHDVLMRMYAAEEDRVRAANGGLSPSFATGSHISVPASLRNAPTRQIDDPEDPAHSPSMVEREPDYSITDLMAEQYGLDAHGQPLPGDQITEAQRRARAARYASTDQEPIPDVALPRASVR